jgi:hypothetical protein
MQTSIRNPAQQYIRLKYKMKNKKAQLQIMENAFILLIIFIILVIAFIFVMSFQRAEQKDKEAEFKKLELVKKSQVLNFLPEMQCSDNNQLSPDCYDILKIESFMTQVNDDHVYYNSLLGNIKITIKRYEPSPDCDCPNNDRWLKTWDIYNNPKEEDKGSLHIQYPVLLADTVNNANYFGVIFLEVYE